MTVDGVQPVKSQPSEREGTMDNLNTLAANFGLDHQISAAEGRLLARTANNDAGKLAAAFEAQGASHTDAQSLASQVLVETHKSSGASPVAVSFPDKPIDTSAHAEREMGTLGANEMVSFSGDREAMVHLMRGATQVNAVGGALGGDDCGGAAATMALIADSFTPEHAAQNADSVTKTAKAMGTTPTAAQQTAIQHLSEGRMSVSDVQQIQVLLYKSGQKFDSNAAGGMSVGMEAGLVGMLRERGGLAHSTVDVNCNRQTVQGTSRTTDHWTVDIRNAAGQTFGNTWRNDGKDRSALVMGAVGQHDRKSDGWQASIHSDSADKTIKADFIQPGQAHAEHAHFDIGSSPSSKGQMTGNVVSAFTNTTHYVD